MTEESIRRDAIASQTIPLYKRTYFIVFFPVYVEMGLSLSDLDRQNLRLTEFAILLSVCFATNTKIMDRCDRGFWSDGARGRCARAHAWRVDCHRKKAPARSKGVSLSNDDERKEGRRGDWIDAEM